MKRKNLESIANAMVVDGKGILAADETVGTITKRLETLKIESTEESRRTYREMLLTAPGAYEFISGVIMYDETIRQKDSNGAPFPEVLTKLSDDHQKAVGRERGPEKLQTAVRVLRLEEADRESPEEDDRSVQHIDDQEVPEKKQEKRLVSGQLTHRTAERAECVDDRSEIQVPTVWNTPFLHPEHAWCGHDQE